MINKLPGYGVVAYLLGKVRTEWLYHGENHLSVRGIHRVAFNKVKSSIGIGLTVGIEAVEVHHSHQWFAAYGSRRQVIEIRTGGVAQILYIELKIRRLHLIRTERINVLHRQVPHWQLGGDGGAFKHLHIERLFGRCHIAAKLAHLIGLSAIGILVCHGEHFVVVERRFERDVAQSAVEGIFALR